MPLSDDAFVIRGGRNSPGNFLHGTGVKLDDTGKLKRASVNAGDELSIEQLTCGDPRTGYPGILNGQIGVTTVGAIRAAGGEVTPRPTKTNPNHAILSGLTPAEASAVFTPTIPNPNVQTGKGRS